MDEVTKRYIEFALEIVDKAYMDAKKSKKAYDKAWAKYLYTSYHDDMTDESLCDVVNSYRKATRHKNRYNYDKDFFTSEWFRILTRGRLDGNAIIEKLEGKI